MRIVFSEQFYHPDGCSGVQLPRDLTTHRTRQGAAVEIVCGSDLYAALDGNDDTPYSGGSGVSIGRVPRILGGSTHEAKLIKQLWFYLYALPLSYPSLDLPWTDSARRRQTALAKTWRNYPRTDRVAEPRLVAWIAQRFDPSVARERRHDEMNRIQ